MSERFPELYPSARRELVFLIVGVIIAVISIYLDHINFYMENTSWFQRSGALLVILGVIAESKYIAKTITKDVVALGSDLNIKQKIAMHSGFIMAVVGTVIWGYGDLVSHT